MRLRVAAVSLGALALIAVASACSPRGNFDGWIATGGHGHGWHTVYAKVPCDQFPKNCGGTGQVDSANKIVYIDPGAVAESQAAQNLLDPSITVLEQVYYHEWGHAADQETGFIIEGNNPLAWERTAQCVMQLITGRSWTPPKADPWVYWICPYGELARTRWILTAKGVI